MKSNKEKLLIDYSYIETYRNLLYTLINQNRQLLDMVNELLGELDYIKGEFLC